MNIVATGRTARREVAGRVAWGLLVLLLVVTGAVDMGRAEPGVDGWSAGCPLHANPGFIALPAVPVIVPVAWSIVPAESSAPPSRPGPAIFVPPRG